MIIFYVLLSMFILISGENNLFCMEEGVDLAEKLRQPDELAQFIKDENYVTSLGLSPDTQTQVARELMLRRVPILKRQELPDPEGRLLDSVSWSTEGIWVVFGRRKTINIFNITLGDGKELKGSRDSVYAVGWSPDGTSLASGSRDGTINLWDTQTMRVLNGHTDNIKSVSWSPDGKKLASGSDDGTVRIWDVQSGQCMYTLPGHKPHFFGSVSWSPDGMLLASCSHDDTVRIWDAQTGQCVRELNGYRECFVSVSWSPDSALLASCSYNDTVRIWNAHTGQCVQTLHHEDWVSSASWSPDGAWLASASSDHTVRIWDTTTGKCVRVLKDHARWVYSVSWSPDGDSLVTISYDKKLFLYDMSNFWQVSELKNFDLKQALLLEYAASKENDLSVVHGSKYLMGIFHSIPQAIKICFPALVSLSALLSYVTNNDMTTTTMTNT